MASSVGVLFIITIVKMVLPAFSQKNDAPALFQEFRHENIAQGMYSYDYYTPDNTHVQQTGGYQLDGNYVVSGSYSYIDPLTKKVYRVNYYADKNGYHPNSISSDGGVGGFGGGYSAQMVATMIG